MFEGTLVTIVAGTEEVTCEYETFNFRLLLVGVVSKFVPVIVTAVPETPIVGVNPVMVGADVEEVTVKDPALEAEPDGEVTEIGPVVAPDGTTATI